MDRFCINMQKIVYKIVQKKGGDFKSPPFNEYSLHFLYLYSLFVFFPRFWNIKTSPFQSVSVFPIPFKQSGFITFCFNFARKFFPLEVSTAQKRNYQNKLYHTLFFMISSIPYCLIHFFKSAPIFRVI